MEDNNKKLAELLGIKPERHFVRTELSFMSDCKIIEVYPDFTTPENFIKLLKIENYNNPHNRIGIAYPYIWSYENPEERLINNLITDIEAESFLTKTKNIKKQAQKIEWSY